MKKILFTALMVFAFGMNASAQNVITNDYQTPITGADGQNVNESNDGDKETFGTIGLMYYGFKDLDNYGLYWNMDTPNGFGMDFALRAQFKSHGNFNLDLLFNYSFALWQQNENQLLLTLAAGPSFRSQEAIDGFNKNGSPTYKDKLFVDCGLNPRLTVKVGKFALTGGFYYWAPKFKFSKDDGAQTGFNVGLGYCF